MSFMQDSKTLFEKAVQSLSSLPEPERRLRAFLFVREIPYGNTGSRSPYDVLTNNKGTCSGKHALLKLILEALGYEVQAWFAIHDFGKFPVSPWPAELKEFQGKQIADYHDFLKVNIDGRWVTIDAIFDLPMRQWGFLVQDWDGNSDMPLPVKTDSMFVAEGDVEGCKKSLIGALPEATQNDRKIFLKALTAWVDARR